MKKTLILTSLFIAALMPSCVREDPAYQQYKAEQAAAQAALTAQQQAGQDVITDTTNPYAAPGNGPVNLPVNQPVDQYSSLPPLPGGGNAIQNPVNIGNIPAPINNTFHNTSSHTVVSGDTIWGLSKKYNVSQDSIMAANAFTSSTIRIGQEVLIPQP